MVEEEKLKLILVLRIMNIVQRVWEAELKNWAALVFNMSTAILISILFCTIHCADACGLALTLVALLVAFLFYTAIRITLELGSGIHESSKELLASFERNKHTLTDLERKAFKSCSRIRIALGPSYISRDTITYVMQDVVVGTTIDLVLGFE